MGDVTVRMLRGAGIEEVLAPLAELRMTVFRAWPYLYDGDLDYERRYLAHLAASRQGVVVGAFAGRHLVGAATALPLADEDGAFRQPFERVGEDVAAIFYLAESVLLPAFRGRGLGHRFFDLREAAARDHGFTRAAFCAVLRGEDDRRRPADHRPLDAFWRKRGYEPVAGLICRFSWRDLGHREETEKPLQVWARDL